MIENYSTPMELGILSVFPCCEQMLAIGAQAMYIACNDTSVIVINFRKSKTHAITDTYCTWKSTRAGSQIYPKTPPQERGNGQRAPPGGRERPVCFTTRLIESGREAHEAHSTD